MIHNTVIITDQHEEYGTTKVKSVYKLWPNLIDIFIPTNDSTRSSIRTN